MHQDTDEHESTSQTDKTIQAGTRFLAGGIGGGIGYAIAGLPGAMIGNALPVVLEEVSSRLLGKRERERIGAVYILTKVALQEYLDSGLTIRDDGFFRQTPDGERAAGEEIVEAILTTAQREYEEGKLLYFANLMAAIAVRPDLSRSRSAHLVKLAQNLSMTQLTLLAIANDPNDKQVLRTSDYTEASIPVDSPLASLLSEMSELDRQNLITFASDFITGVTNINPSTMRLEGDGFVLHKTMKLERIGPNRREEIKTLLS